MAAVAAAVVTLVTFAHLLLVPSVGQDPALGLLAVEQRLRGRALSITEVALADPEDVSRDLRTPITWWETPRAIPPGLTVVAPGSQAVVYPLRSAGLSLGASLRVVVLVAWLAGIAGWTLYFRSVMRHDELAWALVAAFALFRMSHASAYSYLGGETLLWAAYPFAAWASLHAVLTPRRRPLWSASAGGLTLVCLALKPSAAFLVAALAWWWLLLRARRKVTWGELVSFALGATAVVAIGHTLGLMPWHPFGAARNADLCSVDPVAAAMWASGGWLMGMSDLAAAVESAGRWLPPLVGRAGPAEFLWLSPRAIAGLSLTLAAAFVIWWLRAASPAADASERHVQARSLAAITIMVVAAGLLAMQLRGACVSFEGRHQQYGAFLALPLVVSALAVHLRSRARRARTAALLLAAVLIGVPASYGAAALLENVLVEMPRRAATVGDDGIRRDWLPPHVNARELERAFDRVVDRGRVLVLRNAVRATAFPDRRHFIAWDEPARHAPPAGLATILVGSETTVELAAFLPANLEWDTRELLADVRVLLSVEP
jgi:hypothetical protein